MPMNTQWSIGSMRRKCNAWSRISEALRLRPNFIVPVAQNVHVNGQPDCDDTQIERRPPPPPGVSRYRISTASSGRPSAVSNRALMVPSLECASSRRLSVENGSSCVSDSRSSPGRLVIC